MAEPTNMILPMLREMRAELLGRFDEMDARFDAIEREQQLIEAAFVARRAWLEQTAARIRGRRGAFNRQVQELEPKK